MQILMILLMFLLATPHQRIETKHPDRSKVIRVETAMNHLTVIELAEPVMLAAAGSALFKIERRENKVFIQPLEEGASTNLFVWTNSDRWNYELVPAVSVDSMLFAIDQQAVARPAAQESAVPALNRTTTRSIAEEMLLFAKPIRNLGKPQNTSVSVLLTDIYRKGDQLFVQYVVNNRTTRPSVVGEPEVFALQSASSETSLYAYRYSQVDPEFQKKIRSRGQVKIALVECDVPSDAIPPGESAKGIFILQAPSTNPNSEPSVFRFVFPTGSPQPTSLTLVL